MRRSIIGFAFCLAAASAFAQEPAPTPAPTPAPAPEAAKPAVAAAPPAAAMAGSAKIICAGKAKAVGECNFVFTPASGEAKTVRVTLTKGMGKDEICRDVAKELSVALSGGPYKVDQYDDDKVKVDGKDDTKFSLTLGGVTAKGVKLEVK